MYVSARKADVHLGSNYATESICLCVARRHSDVGGEICTFN